MKTKRNIFFITVGISFLAILIYNFLTPLMSDDLLVNKEELGTFWDIIKAEYQQYMTWTGRSVLQVLLKIFTVNSKWIFNIFNSICFVSLMLLIYLNVDCRGKYNSLLYLMINLFVWIFGVEFEQTVLWLGGACNYLWGTTIILSYVTWFRYYLNTTKTTRKQQIPAAVFLFLFGVVAGWCNENTSGGGIVLMLLFLILHVFQKKALPIIGVLSSFVGVITGFLFMVCAPGNKIRGGWMLAEESHSGLMTYVSRGLKILKALDRYMFLYFAIIIILTVYLVQNGKKIADFYTPAIFFIGGLATCGALILTPEPMPRAYFGANIFFGIVAFNVIQMIEKKEKVLYALRTGIILTGAVWMFFVYVEDGANLARNKREVDEREAYILEQTSAGNYDLTLPKLRPEFKNKYTFLYENDLSTKKDFWINEVFKIRYGIESLTVVEREAFDGY